MIFARTPTLFKLILTPLYQWPYLLQGAAIGFALFNLSGCIGSTPNETQAKRPLNDTGTPFCRDTDSAIADCNVTLLQDGNSGQDSAIGTKTGSGPFGFDWSKININGQALTHQNQAWQTEGSETTFNQWSCVYDNHTGLMWEIKSDNDQAWNHYRLRYSWFNNDPLRNGGEAGLESDDDCNGVACNTQAYINELNRRDYCGRDDWRLPTVNEMLSIVITNNVDLVTDTHYFPNTANDEYWSRESYAPDRERVWYTYFSDGGFGFSFKVKANFVRAVSDRGLPPNYVADTNERCVPSLDRYAPNSRFTLDGPTAYDKSTGLTWQRCPLGFKWSNASGFCERDENQPLRYTWAAALEAAVLEADNARWRLPNKNELASLIDHGCTGPALNDAAFKGAADGYWSSTPGRREAGFAWHINFLTGTLININTESVFYVRLVKD